MTMKGSILNKLFGLYCASKMNATPNIRNMSCLTLNFYPTKAILEVTPSINLICITLFA